MRAKKTAVGPSTKDAHRMDSDAIKTMLRTGEGPWVSSGAGIEMYWGEAGFQVHGRPGKVH